MGFLEPDYCRKEGSVDCEGGLTVKFQDLHSRGKFRRKGGMEKCANCRILPANFQCRTKNGQQQKARMSVGKADARPCSNWFFSADPLGFLLLLLLSDYTLKSTWAVEFITWIFIVGIFAFTVLDCLVFGIEVQDCY